MISFDFDKDLFAKALYKALQGTSSKSTIPILGNVKLELEGNVLDISATDLEVGIKASYTVAGKVNGAITVPAKKLHEIVKELPAGDVSFTVKGNDRVELVCGSVKFNIVGLDVEGFPLMPATDKLKFLALSKELVAELIGKTSYATSTDETKHNLNGAFIKATPIAGGKAKLAMVGTDSHRLSCCEKEIEGDLDPQMEKGVILPNKGLVALANLAEEQIGGILLGFDGNNLVALGGSTVLTMRLIEGDFPDYAKVIPVANDKSVLVDRDKILPALKRMAILPSEKIKGVKMEVAGRKMTLSSADPVLGDSVEDLEAIVNGTALTGRFNARFLIDVLGNMGGSQAEIRYKDDITPILIKTPAEDDFNAVLMPMRL